MRRDQKSPRLASYCAMALLPKEKEQLLAMGPSFDEVVEASMLSFAELDADEQASVIGVQFKRWNGVCDAGEWVFCAQRTPEAFLKFAKRLESIEENRKARQSD